MTQEFIKAFSEAKESAWKKQTGGLGVNLKHKFSMFRRKEDGSLIIFGLYMLICMLVIGGLAVDAMRGEYQRTKIQATTDRALLAAASINQTLPAQEIFDDYFAKAGMPGLAPTATVDGSEHYRRVSAEYAADNVPTIDTIFMSEAFRDILQVGNAPEAGGVNELSTFASGVAIDGVSKVEISLVLDVSGSMYGTKLADLKVAAKDFFDTLLLTQPDDDTYSISIIPYSTQVNAGAKLLSKYNASGEHDYSHCVDFTGDDFNTASLSTTDQLQRTGHFHPWNKPYKYKDNSIHWSYRVCPPRHTREILPLSGDINELKTYIDAFEASGNTSTDVGIKWGAALLDPSARDAITALVSEGEVDSKFSGRPFSYTEPNIRKVMVVMTDGNNTNQYYLKPEVSGGFADPDDNMSNVWHRVEYDYRGRRYDRYAIYNPDRWSSDKYYHPDKESTNRGSWRSAPSHSSFEQLSYTKLYDHASVRYVAKYLMSPAGYNYNEWRYNKYSYVHPTVKDTRMANICEATKNNGVMVYTIGFEVTLSNATKLSHCATSAGHYYGVNANGLSAAFASIAAQLHSLRLEQ